jgi:hypothetical protein
MHYHAYRHVPSEWGFLSDRRYEDPFSAVTLDVVFRGPSGDELCVPAFWAGEETWRVRFSAREVGVHQWRTVSSDDANSGLHGVQGTLTVEEYAGSNPLFRHGPLRVAGGRYLEHEDGTPFFWLGDTWWMGLCRRLSWPDDFQRLTVDRVSKGFTVVQIVAGLYPDMGAFDARGANEAGFPWEGDWRAVRPAYFDMADVRLSWLVRQGIVPCLVGCWGYYIHLLGVERMKQHWRYLVARYGAYPVVWCVAGEVLMPYYRATAQEREDYAERTRAAWAEVAAYLRGVDPYHRPITAHPTGGAAARANLEDDASLDFDMLQTGHDDRASVSRAVELVIGSREREPAKPVINGEPCYEGILEAGREEVQRMLFWACMLSGAAGHTYGANGIWQVNTGEQPFGPSPHGYSWGDTPWEEAMRLPGSGQLGLAKRLLQRYRWWQFEPHPEWVEPRWDRSNFIAPYAAGVPREVRVIFSPATRRAAEVRGLEQGVVYRAFYSNPKNGREYELGETVADSSGCWRPAPPPIFQDWLLVLEAASAAAE